MKLPAEGSIFVNSATVNASSTTATPEIHPTAPAAVCQNGVMDYALHPIEPLAVRLTIAAAF